MLAVLTALLVAVPAAAQSPAPTVLTFDDTDAPGQYTATLTQRGAGCTGEIFRSDTGPHGAPSFLFAPCRPTLRLTFPTPKASIELFARALVATAPELVATAHSITGMTTTVTIPDPSTWKPVVLAAPAGGGGIDYIELRAEGADLGIDDLALSSAPQPDSSVLSGPPARAEAGPATFSFGANRPDIAGWRCSLDGAAFSACQAPVTIDGLAAGAHTFQVAAIDSYGAVDPSPAEYAWTVLGPLPDTPSSPGTTPVVNGDTVSLDLGTPGAGVAGFECSVDSGPFNGCTSPFTVGGLAPGVHTIDVRAVDADGRADPTPQRWTFAVPDPRPIIGADVPKVADLDHDQIPDSQEVLPLGNVPPLAGIRTLVRLISGTVYVKLPSNAARPLQAGPLAGFIPLKGIAALPIGTIVDARLGSLSVQSAADGRAVTDPRRRVGQATLASSIFQIRQARLRRAALRARAIPTSLVLASAPADSLRCRGRAPVKGAVRTLAAQVKGLFRVSGGASRAEGRNASWRTTDRCNGTTTRVTRGIVVLYDKVRKRTVTLRAGARYVARARLFQARKGIHPLR